MVAVMFKGKKLTGSFVASQPLELAADELTMFWTATCSGGGTTLEWYVEFSADLQNWYAEVDEQDTGSGVVKMSKAVRTFYETGGAVLVDDTHKISTQLVRRAPYARVQARVSGGAATIDLTAPAGSVPKS